MADPKDPTPVRVEKRGDGFAIVDANGKALADGDSYTDEAKANADAEQINGSWKKAAKERKAHGAPAVMESRLAAKLAELDVQESFSAHTVLKGRGRHEVGAALNLRFDPRLHPRDRHGEFSGVLRKMLAHDGTGASAELPHGVKVERRSGKLRVSSPYGVSHFHTPEAAAAVALAGVDKGEVEHGADPEMLYRNHMDELASGRSAAISSNHIGDMEHVEGVMKAERIARSARILQGPFPESHKGRTRSSLAKYAGEHAGTPESARRFADTLKAAGDRRRAQRVQMIAGILKA